MANICFWQRMVTPHMCGLAEALARRGHCVRYFAEQEIEPDRMALGWEVPRPAGVDVKFVSSAAHAVQLVRSSGPQTVHLTQGFRSNGLVHHAQTEIRRFGAAHYVVMEAVDDAGILGPARKFVYRGLLYRWSANLDGVLAIGYKTPRWIEQLCSNGIPAFPFAYFLPKPEVQEASIERSATFRFIFVGQLIKRKRLDGVFRALSSIREVEFELVIVGSGVEEGHLRRFSGTLLPGRVRFCGKVLSSRVPAIIAGADCLVLPSRHDGWGAVVSEAMMVGTPVVCTTACGAAKVVEASGYGATYELADEPALARLCAAQLSRGKVKEQDRAALGAWSECLGADTGAAYFESILDARAEKATRPPPPWLAGNASPLSAVRELDSP